MAVDKHGNSLVEQINSPVTGEKISYFPPKTKAHRRQVSQTIISIWILVVLGTVFIIFVAKVITVQMVIYFNPFFPKSGPGLPLAGYICDVANVAQACEETFSCIVRRSNVCSQVIIYGQLYKERTAQFLNQYENHQTETEFEDALIGKVFIFNFINTFAAVFTVGFLKQVC